MHLKKLNQSCIQFIIYILSRDGITPEIFLTCGCTKATQISEIHFVWWGRLIFSCVEFKMNSNNWESIGSKWKTWGLLYQKYFSKGKKEKLLLPQFSLYPPFVQSKPKLQKLGHFIFKHKQKASSERVKGIHIIDLVKKKKLSKDHRFT